MSLTSYRAAPPRVNLVAAAGLTMTPSEFPRQPPDSRLRAHSSGACGFVRLPVMALQRGNLPPEPALAGARTPDRRRPCSVLDRPGGDLLSRALRRSTIGAEGFHGRVRDGIGCWPLAITTRPVKNRYSGAKFQSRQMTAMSSDRCVWGFCLSCPCGLPKEPYAGFRRNLRGVGESSRSSD